MSLDTDVRAAIVAQLDTVVGLPPAAQWAGRLSESAAFEPTIGVPHLRLSMRWATERLRTFPARNGLVERNGWTALVLCEPIDPPVSTLEDMARAVLNAFPPGLTLMAGSERLQILRSRRWFTQRLDGWAQLPVDIDWQLITVNTLV